jgi:3-oxoacyl-[acyl-carrier protein] reductase
VGTIQTQEDDERPVALVTGAARNLGRTIALELARQGHDVVVHTRADLARAEAVAAEVGRLGVRALPLAADLADAEAPRVLVNRALDWRGRLDVLVNNAAIRTAIDPGDLAYADWRAAHAVTLDGAFLCAQAALPAMRARGFGRVINLLGRRAQLATPDRVHVAAAKHGLIGLTRSLAGACVHDGVTVNAVSPGHMRGDSPEAERARQQVAAVVAFLASEPAGGVTGEVIAVAWDAGGREWAAPR